MKHKVVLLLSGCIQPNIKNDVLAIADVETRKKQYVEAIKWYAQNTPYKIVFCENSGYDLSGELSNWGGKLSSFHLWQARMEQTEARGTRKWKSWSIFAGIPDFTKREIFL